MIYDHLQPFGHPLPFLGQPKQTCPKSKVLPQGFVDDPAPKPNYLPGVQPTAPGTAPPPPPPKQDQETVYAPKENRFLPITIAALVIRGVIALIRRAP